MISLKKNRNIKKDIGVLLGASLVYITPIVALLAYGYFNSSLRYKSHDVIGWTEHEIMDRYGKFDLCKDIDGDGNIEAGAYEVIDGFIWMDYYYYFFFDQNGKVREIGLATENYYGG